MMTQRTIPAASLALVSLLGCAAFAGADIVRLHNGNALEGVVVEQTMESVRLRLPFGEIGLSRASVQSVELRGSAFEDYLRRSRALEVSRAPAREWLSLADWARAQGLDHSAREAALTAARLRPELEGLAPLMRGLGYALDERLGRWVTHDDFMRQRGYTLVEGRWLTAAELEARRRARLEAADSRRERARRERLARAVELLVWSQIAQAEESRRLREEALAARAGLPLYGGYPVAIVPGLWPSSHGGSASRAAGRDRKADARRELRRAHQEALLSRPPGSLIPVPPPGSHRGRFEAASGPD